ncbi:MAG TPA: hypothetical protein VEX68_27995 [Bryobacteraceae bacterium]|nr:hypothetical protein [Bryobacteraceae bacterium]
MLGDHGVEIVDRRVHVHGAHAIDVTVGRGEGLDALLEVTGTETWKTQIAAISD